MENTDSQSKSTQIYTMVWVNTRFWLAAGCPF